MIKQPTAVRERVLSDVVYMLKHLYTMLTLLPETEIDVLTALERPRSDLLAVELTVFIMDKFGPALRRPNHTAVNTEPRFDKARRALAKKTPKGPRGVPRQKIDPIEQETV